LNVRSPGLLCHGADPGDLTFGCVWSGGRARSGSPGPGVPGTFPPLRLGAESGFCRRDGLFFCKGKGLAGRFSTRGCVRPPLLRAGLSPLPGRPGWPARPCSCSKAPDTLLFYSHHSHVPAISCPPRGIFGGDPLTNLRRDATLREKDSENCKRNMGEGSCSAAAERKRKFRPCGAATHLIRIMPTEGLARSLKVPRRPSGRRGFF
jgi:hypothetical protein